MTQQQLAEEVGVTRQTIIAIEANRYSPSLRLAFRVARAFDASIEDVFQYSQPTADPPIDEREKHPFHQAKPCSMPDTNRLP